MNRLVCLVVCVVVAMAMMTGFSPSARAAELTFQLVNDTDRALSLKLFSRGESSRQWPAKTKAYSVRPDTAVQQLKIKCDEGEPICWGAWVTVQSVTGGLSSSGQRDTRTSTYQIGVGERGMIDCPTCCHVCKDGAITPVFGLRNSSAQTPDVR